MVHSYLATENLPDDIGHINFFENTKKNFLINTLNGGRWLTFLPSNPDSPVGPSGPIAPWKNETVVTSPIEVTVTLPDTQQYTVNKHLYLV